MRRPLLVLLIIGFIAYLPWFSFNVFAYGDWWFSFPENLVANLAPAVAGQWGGPWLWKYPYLFLQGIFGALGLGSNVSDKFLVFWQIALLAPLTSFFLVRKITKSNLAGFIGSLIFSYNTYFLSINTQGHELLPVAFTWGVLAVLSSIYLLETKKKIFIPITTLLLFVTGFYDFRSLYIVAGVIFLYFTYNQFFLEIGWRNTLKQNLSSFLLIFVSLLFLNLYWIVPTIAAGSLTSNEFLSRGIFGSEYYNLQSSLAFFYPYWTGKETTWLYLQKIPMHFWLYPILAFSGLLAFRKNKTIAFFGLLALIGIFLAKQEAPPFGQIYIALFNYVPGFSAFREASKFDFLIIISYAVLIGAFAEYIWNKFKGKRLKYVIVFLIVLLPLWNTKPLITGEIKTMFVPISISPDFVKLKEHILSDSVYSRVIGISLNAKYNFSTNLHPERDLLYSMAHFWGADIVSYNFEDKSQLEGVKLMNYLETDEARRLLSASSVGYMPVFIKADPTYQSIRRDLGKDRAFFEERMDKIPYLVKADLGMENIILYATSDFKHHLYLTSEPETLKKDVPYSNVDIKMVNPSEYRFTVKDLNRPMYLNFTELYSPVWKIRVGDFKWWEVLYKKDYFLPEEVHSQNTLRFNQFYLDPNEVCQSTPCTLEATLYARPQSYLYLGLILSGGALVVVIGSIFYLWRKNEK